MSIGFLKVTPISRAAGRSAPASAAYRAALRIVDERTGEIHDYTRKQGVVAVALVGWEGTAHDLAQAMEAAERRKDARVARDLVLALPADASPEQRLALAVEMAEWIHATHGIAALVAVHEPSRNGSDRNHHAHLLLSTRRSDGRGLGEKARELDDRKTGPEVIEAWRAKWGELIGQDMRSYRRRGLDVVPEPKLPIPEQRATWRAERDARRHHEALVQRSIQLLQAELAEIEAEERRHAELEAARAALRAVDRAAVAKRPLISNLRAELSAARRDREALARVPRPARSVPRPAPTPTGLERTGAAHKAAQEAAERARQDVPAWRRWWPALWPVEAVEAAEKAARWRALVAAGRAEPSLQAAAERAAAQAMAEAQATAAAADERALQAWQKPRERAQARVERLEQELRLRTAGARRAALEAERTRPLNTNTEQYPQEHRHEPAPAHERRPEGRARPDLDEGLGPAMR